VVCFENLVPDLNKGEGVKPFDVKFFRKEQKKSSDAAALRPTTAPELLRHHHLHLLRSGTLERGEGVLKS
jgi:hypothetical protein